MNLYFFAKAIKVIAFATCLTQAANANTKHSCIMCNAAKPIPELTEQIKRRFNSKLKPKNDNGCVEWSDVGKCRGYGRFRVGKRKLASHRVAWAIRYGQIPDGMFVCHKCDNPSCCNPDHLFLGTHEDNMADMSRKGRTRDQRGDKHHFAKNPSLIKVGEQSTNAKLTEIQVRLIKEKLKSGKLTQVAIASEFNVTGGCIHLIHKGVNWSHI